MPIVLPLSANGRSEKASNLIVTPDEGANRRECYVHSSCDSFEAFSDLLRRRLQCILVDGDGLDEAGYRLHRFRYAVVLFVVSHHRNREI